MATIGAPLPGAPWVAVYSEPWELGHRRVLYAIKGRVLVPGRFAIGWMKLNTNANTFKETGRRLLIGLDTGLRLSLVSDGVVVATRDRIAENSHVVALQGFRVLGTYASPAASGKSLPSSLFGPTINGELRGELPAAFAVVSFPDSSRLLKKA